MFQTILQASNEKDENTVVYNRNSRLEYPENIALPSITNIDIKYIIIIIVLCNVCQSQHFFLWW